MKILEFRNYLIEALQNICPSIERKGAGVKAIYNEDSVTYSLPAIVVMLDFNNMEEQPGRVSTITEDKEREIGRTSKTRWHHYDLPITIGSRAEHVDTATDIFEKIHAGLGKHLRLEGVPLDMRGISQPKSEGMYAYNLDYLAWFMMEGTTEEGYLVQEFNVETIDYHLNREIKVDRNLELSDNVGVRDNIST